MSKKIFFISCFLLTFYLFNFFIERVHAIDTSAPTWELPEPKLQISIPTVSFSKPVVCETKNGQDIYCVNWIGEYISGIYKYAIGIVGILAAIMLMVGGVVWLTSGGSPDKVKQAQDYIKGSITGLVLALTSYLILFQVNPDLVSFKVLRVAMVKKEPSVETAAVSASAVCQNSNMTVGAENMKAIDYNETPKRQLPSACASLLQNNFFKNSYGIQPEILAAIAARETGGSCNQVGQKSPSGDCGLMQINIATARGLNSAYNGKSDDYICNDLNSNAALSVNLASQYISQGIKNHSGKPEYIFAYYNSGAGGVSPSRDCGPSYKAFQCCINPGELSGTQNYVYEAYGYYLSSSSK